MKSVHLLAVAVGAGVAQKVLRWWQGYSVDVDAGLGLLAPLVYLPVAAVPALIAGVAIVRVLVRRPPVSEQLILLSISLLVVLLQVATPSPTMAGFEMRMNRFGEPEFQALASSIRSMRESERFAGDRFGQKLAKALRNDHAILRVSSWQPKIFVSPLSVRVLWGSGLTGALAVEIQDAAMEPSVSADVLNSEKLFPRVQLLQIF